LLDKRCLCAIEIVSFVNDKPGCSMLTIIQHCESKLHVSPNTIYDAFRSIEHLVDVYDNGRSKKLYLKSKDIIPIVTELNQTLSKLDELSRDFLTKICLVRPVGQSGFMHKNLTNLIIRIALKKGYRLESLGYFSCNLPSYKPRYDIVLENDVEVVAIEISITTDAKERFKFANEYFKQMVSPKTFRFCNVKNMTNNMGYFAFELDGIGYKVRILDYQRRINPIPITIIEAENQNIHDSYMDISKFEDMLTEMISKILFG